MARPRLILDVSNLTAHYKRFVRTGIQEVVYQTLLAAHRMRGEFSEIDIVLMPFLPRKGMIQDRLSTLLPYADTPISILREIEGSLGVKSQELWGIPIPESDEERRFVLSTAKWIHFQGLINIVPLVSCFQRNTPALSMTVYDLIPVLFPEYTPNGIARWFQTQYLPGLASCISKAVCISYSTARDLRGNSVSEKIPDIFALPLPFDPLPHTTLCRDVLSRFSLLEGDYLVYVGSLEPRKNLASVIDGLELYAKLYSDSNLKLVWVGSTGWKNDWILRKLGRSLVKDRVVRTGYLSDQDLDQLVRLSTGVIMLSQYEGFGLPVAQAFSRGVPIITNYSSSLPEACLGDALFCDPSDSRAVAQAMRESLVAPISRFRKMAVQRWDWNLYTKDLIRIITGQAPQIAKLV